MKNGMSSRLQLAFASSFLCMSVLACGNLFAKKDDAGAPDAAAVSGSGIENEAAITRYPDERPAGDEVKTVRSAVVHATYPGTDIVATLAPDSTVTEVAVRAGGVLVVFEQAGTKKMGWIDAAAVPPIAGSDDDEDDAAVAKTTTPSTAARKDAGAAGKLLDAGAPAKVVDAGAPAKVVDAGAPAKVVDAGAPKAAADAGAPKTATKQVLKEMPASGKCDSGYYEYPKNEKKCRLVCKADTECGGTLKCRDMNGHKICYR